MIARHFEFRLLVLALATVAVATLPGGSASAADAWLNSSIVPRSEDVRIVVESRVVGGVSDVIWPAVVQRREGQWLWIAQTEAVHGRAVRGWINKADALPMDKVHEYCTLQLAENPSPFQHWLRGLYWESQGEPSIAELDFQQALAGNRTVGDAHLRLGRLQANAPKPVDLARKAAAVDSSFSGEPLPEPGSVHGLAHFDEAIRRAVDPTLVRFHWAEAHRKAHAKSRSVEDFRLAQTKYQQVVAQRPTWSQAHHGYAQLLLAHGKPATDASSNDDDAGPTANAASLELVREAVAHFNETLRLHPRHSDALAARAEAYLTLSMPNEALASATKACTICYYRNTQSLAILARSYAAAQSYNRAAYFAHKAAEYAQHPAEQMRLLKEIGSYNRLFHLQNPDVVLAANAPSVNGVDGANGAETGAVTTSPKSRPATNAESVGGIKVPPLTGPTKPDATGPRTSPAETKATNAETAKPYYSRPFIPRSLSAFTPPAVE